ncbi:beta-galactosidase [Microbacterium terrae]|uniref:Beta-galactosidase n=1 Tax=Microbacterium terrae TaxID=69369 RepID=A0A0M2HM82_9MICO|nr:beta-galactosidase [Microbacterium terrae]KJL45558.1 Beta-galactosidase bgaB [Microbacterium terrae]MBP1079393.1 beta-galactosidase [Microbacterium terrae]GLJ98793.1 beta-galactosidase [Microbacterium terrae]
MLYGADYNPDQWPEEVWDDDVRLMREAGVNIVSLGIFAWSRIQPSEDVWDFAWLDTVIEKLHAGGIQVNLATATASPPPWVSATYPDTLPADESGASYWPGSRQHFAPSSPTYRRLAGELVRRIAERYVDHPAVVMWHVGNEFGCHLWMDFSDSARDAYRRWLTDRYTSIDALNEAWGTSFWSQRYGSFDEIFPPRLAPYSHNPSSMLDWRRFTSDMLLECYLMERAILLEAGATQPITTNFMGPFKPADYSAWAPHMDLIADDCYPDPTSPTRVRDAAFQRDLIRSLKPGVPWVLWEQATDAVNWRPANPGKKPGALMAETAQSIGRGADGIMFFQWRQSRAGSEKFHSAMLPHAGTDTRTWQAVTELGARLKALGELPAPGRDARVALVFDWESWWAVEERDHPVEVDYLAAVLEWYGALHSRGIQVDIIAPERVDDGYDLALAPVLYLLREEGATALTRFVDGGGTLLAGPFTDVVDGHDQFRPGGFVTQLRDVLGIRFEDFGALGGASVGGMGVGALSAAAAPAVRATAAFTVGGTPAEGRLVAESIHAVGADVVSHFETGAAAGRPALTRHRHGAGEAWYIATLPDTAGADAVVAALVESSGVRPVVAGLPADVEVARRGDLVTLINHGDDDVDIAIEGTDAETGAPVESVRLASQEAAFVLAPVVVAASGPLGLATASV